MSAMAAEHDGRTDRCKSCHAPIWWGLTAKGKRMPIDTQTAEDGNVVIDRLEQVIATEPVELTVLPRVRVLGKGEVVDDATPRYRPHWSTCTDPKRHRREARRHNGSRAKARAMGIEARS